MGHETKLNYLTGIRAYAALGVVMIHIFGIFTPALHPSIMGVIYLGPNGVMIFFVLSAFTIAMSLQAKSDGWAAYGIKRFFRIAPAYYLMLTIILFGRESSFADLFDTPFDLRSFLYHLTFMNWIDFRHTNNALGVEWTLSIEMLFYLLLPGFVSLSRSVVGALALLLFAVSMHLLAPPGPVTEVWKWSPAPYAICFVAGVLAFRLAPVVSEWRLFSSGAVMASILAVALVMRPELGFSLNIFWWTAVTVLLLFSGRSSFSKLIFENRIALWLGERSYAIYLVHLPLLEMIIKKQHGPLGAAVTLALTILSAMIMHRYIEKPGIWLGRFLAGKSSERRRIRLRQLASQNALGQ